MEYSMVQWKSYENHYGWITINATWCYGQGNINLVKKIYVYDDNLEYWGESIIINVFTKFMKLLISVYRYTYYFST